MKSYAFYRTLSFPMTLNDP